MDEKDEVLERLREVLMRWEDLLRGLGEEAITAPVLDDGWAVQDVIGHLRAWQQVSVARLEAAKQGQSLVMPDWLRGMDPEADENRETYNARIFEVYHGQPWSQVHEVWKNQFRYFLAMGEDFPADVLADKLKYDWLHGYALIDVLNGSLEHHAEHLDSAKAKFKAKS